MAAKTLNCTRKTLYSWIRNEDRNILPHFQDAIEEGRNQSVDFAESILFKMMKEQDRTMVMYYLNNQGKHRGYGRQDEAAKQPVQLIISPESAKYLMPEEDEEEEDNNTEEENDA